MIITLLLVLALIFIEYIVFKSDSLERFFYGKSIIVVDNGQINQQNLKKLRLTVDMLEVRLRQQNIQNISDLQWATIESNGQLGSMLKPEKQQATKEDIQKLISMLQANLPGSTNQSVPPITQSSAEENIFTEVKQNQHKNEPPEHLK